MMRAKVVTAMGRGNYRKLPKDTEGCRKIPKATESRPNIEHC